MMVFSRLRAPAVIAACTVALSLAGAGAAQAQASPAGPRSPAAHFAADATPYQNASIARAMRDFPGGTRISPREVRWPGGAVILRVGPSPTTSAAPSDSPEFADDCPSGYFCVATGAHYTGQNWEYLNAVEFDDEYDLGLVDYWIPWGDCSGSPPIGHGCDAGIHSWANNSGERTWLEQFQDGGNELCISNGQSNSDYTGADDNDYWILMTVNSAAC